MSRALALLTLTLASTAQAEPLVPKNAVEVRLSAPRGKRAFALHPTKDGWLLELGPSAANGVAEVIDLTPGTPARTVALSVLGGQLRFDRARFAGGHAYRVQLRFDGKLGASGLVYLTPEAPAKDAPKKTIQRLRFDPDESASPTGDAIQTVDKSL